MLAPVDNENKVVGQIKSINVVGCQTSANITVNLRTSEQVQTIYQESKENDSSPNLDSPIIGLGRFQNGRIRIGKANEAVMTDGIGGNGETYVRTKLPFALAKTGQASIEGHIISVVTAGADTAFTVGMSTVDGRIVSSKNSKALSPGAYIGGTISIQGITYEVIGNMKDSVTVSSTNPPVEPVKFNLPFTLTKVGKETKTGNITSFIGGPQSSTFNVDKTLEAGAYIGGEINIAGHSFPVVNNIKDEALNDYVVVAPNATLDFVLEDDDDQNPPMHSPLLEDKIKAAYALAYIQVHVDGGGDTKFNKTNIPFRRNTPQDMDRIFRLPGARESANNRADDYWIANVMMVYQSYTLSVSPTATMSDNDGNGEADRPGLAYAEYGKGAVICIEDFNDDGWTLTDEHEKQTWAHEIGHLFNLPDRYAGAISVGAEPAPAGQGGLMAQDSDIFIPRDLRRIRMRRTLK